MLILSPTNENRGNTERSPDLVLKGDLLLTSAGNHWPAAMVSLKSDCPTELPGFEAESGCSGTQQETLLL